MLLDETGLELNRVSYGLQREGSVAGALAGWGGQLGEFCGPGQSRVSNYAVVYLGPMLNELMARNEGAVRDGSGRVADWVECTIRAGWIMI